MGKRQINSRAITKVWQEKCQLQKISWQNNSQLFCNGKGKYHFTYPFNVCKFLKAAPAVLLKYA